MSRTECLWTYFMEAIMLKCSIFKFLKFLFTYNLDILCLFPPKIIFSRIFIGLFCWNPACIQEVLSHIWIQESSSNHPMPTHFNSMSLMIAHLWRNKILISLLKLKPAPHIMNRAYVYLCIWMCLGVWYPYPSVCDILFFNHHTCLLGGSSSLVHSVYMYTLVSDYKKNNR